MQPNQPHYDILSCLGQGSFGKVYKVTNGITISAMKVIKNPGKSAIQELHILKFTKYPTIIRYVHEFLENGSLKIVMEFADQGALSTQTLIWSEEEIWKFKAQMGCALTYLHDNGIIHRNLKPEDILCVSVGNNQRLFIVADFGIAKIVAVATKDNRYTHTYAGTYCYMALEVLNRQLDTVSADIWSLGAVISFFVIMENIPGN